jgi:glycerophosphoryl diester phosphodiesterase
MKKIGHRGVKGYVAENTLASFQKALELGVDGIELDIHLSKDIIPVVIHDKTVDRTTNKNGLVYNYNSNELQNLGIPTLEDVFNLVNQKCFINIEIKDDKATKSVLDLVTKYIIKKNWNKNMFLISSFNWEILEFFHDENSKIPLAVITEDDLNEAQLFAKKINSSIIHPYFKLLNSENVTLMHQNGFKVFPWTVNEISDINLMKTFEVDGIITDFPDRV